MASTNKTTHYELSQYISSDKPTYLVDYNGDMLKIDTGINAAKTTADTASTAATNAQTAAENAATTANTAITNAATAQSGVNTNAAAIGTIANLTTSDKTSLVNAVNEVKGNTTTNAGAINSLTAEVQALEPVLLWTNLSPDSEFAGQRITLDGGYTEYDIIYQVGATIGKFKEMRVRSGLAYDLESISDGAFRLRGLGVSASNLEHPYIEFGNGSFGSTFVNQVTNNNQCIPYKIYGIKD